MPGQSAVSMLEGNRSIIAHAIARQIKQTVPQYRDTDTIPLACNASMVLEAIESLLYSADPNTMARVLDLCIRLHELRGLTVGDFMAATLCALPVLRRYYMTHSSDAQHGVVLYEEIEAVLLPMYGQLALRMQDEYAEIGITKVDRNLGDSGDGKTAIIEETKPFEIVSVEEILDLKADYSRIELERDHLKRELDAMRDAVEQAMLNKRRAQAEKHGDKSAKGHKSPRAVRSRIARS